MKPNQKHTKLKLEKKSIVNLNDAEKKSIAGGLNATTTDKRYTPIATIGSSACDTFWCITVFCTING
jgi:hypothetical protein